MSKSKKIKNATVIVIEVPGNRMELVLNLPISITDVCAEANISVEGRALRLNGKIVSENDMVTTDKSRITLNRGAKGNN